jgi:hypothetical protein
MTNWLRIKRKSTLAGLIGTLVISTLLFSLSSAQAPEPGRAVPAGYFSMQSHSLQSDTAEHTKTLDLMQKAGIHQIRDEIYWWNVEKTKGQLEISPQVKQNVDNTLAKGINLLIILDYGNKFYDNQQAPHTPESREAFAKYCYTIASTFKGKIKYYEIWNEPNLAGFWSPAPDAEEYAKLLQTAYKACKSADPDCVIIGGVTSGTDTDFLEKVFKAGGLQYMDKLSIHPYRNTAPEEGDSLVLQIDKVSKLLEKYNKPLPIWISEMGYPTHKGPNGHPEAKQADYLTRCYLEALTTGKIESFFWYWFGPDGPDEKYSEDRFGIVRQDWTLKPSYQSYQTLATHLAGATFLGSLPSADSSLRIMKFKTTNPQAPYLTVAWTTNGSKNLAFTTEAREVNILDINGDSRKFYPFRKNLTISVTGSPLLIESAAELTPGNVPLVKFTESSLEIAAGSTHNLKVIVDPLFIKGLSKKFSLRNKLLFTSSPSEINLETEDIIIPDAQALDFTRGKNVRIRVPGVLSAKEGKITVTLIQNNRPCGFACISLQITPPALTWMRPFLADESGQDGFSLYIRNMTNIPLSGDIFLNPGDNIVVDNPTPRLEKLLPGNTARFDIHIPGRSESTPDTLFPMGAAIYLDNMDNLSASRTLDYLGCRKADKTPVIDGELDEWNDAEEILINNETQLRDTGKKYNGPKDLSAKIYTLWDKDYLYLAAMVVDDVASNIDEPGTNGYKFDGLEFYFDMACNGDTGNHRYDANDYQLGFFNSDKGPFAWRWGTNSGLDTNARIAWKYRTDLGPDADLKGYVMEAAIPFKDLGFTPKKDKLIGFNVAVDDDDTPGATDPFHQDKYFSWTGDQYNWLDPSGFGFLFFKE